MTLSLSPSLKSAIRARKASSDAPRIWAAKMPALVPPSRATVATGTPEGICRMLNTESHPSMLFRLLMGTPMTGRGVSDAVMPGKCAAPPAPAMITPTPRSAAPRAYSTMRSGVRWADTTVISHATPSSRSTFWAPSITGKSLALPMMMPTDLFMVRRYCPPRSLPVLLRVSLGARRCASSTPRPIRSSLWRWLRPADAANPPATLPEIRSLRERHPLRLELGSLSRQGPRRPRP